MLDDIWVQIDAVDAFAVEGMVQSGDDRLWAAFLDQLGQFPVLSFEIMVGGTPVPGSEVTGFDRESLSRLTDWGDPVVLGQVLDLLGDAISDSLNLGSEVCDAGLHLLLDSSDFFHLGFEVHSSFHCFTLSEMHSENDLKPCLDPKIKFQ